MNDYQQLIIPDLDVTYKGGWCERAIENTTGQSGVYGSAYKAWLANVQHKEEPPKGLYVPIYLSMPNGPKDPDGTQQGDVAISCPDGTVAAAAKSGVNRPLYKYPSLQAYVKDYAKNNGGATLLGWGEYIGKVKVVEGANMETIKILESALNAARQDNFKLQSALNAETKKSAIYESAMNAARKENEELKEAIAKDGTLLPKGKYIVK